MIGRHKRAVHSVAGMYLMILFLNSMKIARVHVSYRAFSRVWAFRPNIVAALFASVVVPSP
jgi:hypothetical protein